jgi:hypothetical protein
VDGMPVLIFYSDFDDKGPPSTFTRSRRRLRRGVKHLLNRPTVTGFEMWTGMLIRALRATGRPVHVNDYDLARQMPEYPVGITGYPRILDWWDLPNPAVLGPGMLDHPAVNPALMKDHRFRLYIVTCQWMEATFKPYYGEKVVQWFAGIDTAAWPNTSSQPKPYDCLIYDKIRWHRGRVVPSLLEPVQHELARLGLSHSVIRYGDHSQATYRKLLAQSRFMVFLCEHETQGFAYQEAMASNLPVLAWDPGFWEDPNRPKYSPDPVPACSVPYFSERCGLKFRHIDEFTSVLEQFLQRLESFSPRHFVEKNLSMQASAEIYMSHYGTLATSGVPAKT